MAEGDAPGFKFMADNYSMSDNYHQAVMGGTGANHIAIGTGQEAVYRNAAGQLVTPPANQIEDPNAYPGSNDAYTNDGYSGGSFTDCSDPSAPGVAPIESYQHSLPYAPFRGGDCTPGAYYLLNNYNPGYLENGTPAPLGPTQYTVPPQTFPTIANSLSAHGISWGYFGQGFANGVADANYCNICDPFAYSSSIMTNPTLRANTELGYSDFESDVKSGQIDHTYTDHVSILKFIEANWHLAPLAPNSRDNLPNPKPGPNPYIPANQPAIGNLMTLFDFKHMRTNTPMIPIDPGEPAGQLPNT